MGWAGTVLLLAGAWLLSRRDRHGFVFYLLGSLFWCAQGAVTRQWDLVAVEAVFVAVNAWSWWKWREVDVGT